MTQNKKIKKYTTFREMHDMWMKDPAFVKACEETNLEFTLIRALIDKRIKEGMTQKILAEKVGTKQSSIARFESGMYNPTISFIQKLATALDLKIKVM